MLIRQTNVRSFGFKLSKLLRHICFRLFLLIFIYSSYNLFVETMSGQLTLFGTKGFSAPYFKNPSSDYQRFVNKKWRNERFEKKVTSSNLCLENGKR